MDAADLPAAGAGERSSAAAVRELAEEAGLVVARERLVKFSHWTTPIGFPTRFATDFFLAAAPRQPVRVDAQEILAHAWRTPRQALLERARGAIKLPPPTFVTLSRLTHHGSVQEALETAAASSPEQYFPRPQAVEGGRCSLYAPDAAYDGGALESPGPRHRLWMLEDAWRYERDGF